MGKRGTPRMSEAHKAEYIGIGKRLRAARKAKGVTQEQVARWVGMTFQQIQKYENGSNRIPVYTLRDIAQKLEQPLSYFIEYDQERMALVNMYALPGGADLVDIFHNMPSADRSIIVQIARLLAKSNTKAKPL